ncbi:DUF2169 domain-containing protein [Desulfococcaceae bacterium HSG7]|nr:DUF2169 domain-containing protein [Desulfococcaceae bacterium HSG7]
MKIIRPLQLSFNHQVLEQNKKFYFTASATLGVHLQTGEECLDLNYLKDAFECMGETSLPDMGMPKPTGEFLVSGSFYPPQKQAVSQGMVKVKLGQQEKELHVYGLRQWGHGLASPPEPFEFMPIDYKYAFGGSEYEKNPAGIGYKDGYLPCIEFPDQMILSPNDKPEPAGFSGIDPTWPQRMRFQGTYDRKYLKKYFPGYPVDFDWAYFLCAPEDQWCDTFYKGNEPFEIYNMHPDIPLIKGSLPDLYARCFLMHTLGQEPEFSELPLELDTIWFFPEKLLALQIWRGVAEVSNDEADDITHVLAAYEDSAHPPRTYEHYLQAFEKRLNSDDVLLTNFNTEDLIPIGAKCAMELLQEMAFADDEQSELAKNIDAKAESIKKMADEKVEEAIQQAEKNMAKTDIPDEAKAKMPDGGKIDIRKMLKKSSEAKPDPDVVALNKKLESILPGITAGDPKKIELKKFSFDKIDKIMAAVGKLTDKKEKEAKTLAKEEIAKAKEQVKEQLQKAKASLKDVKAASGETEAKLEETLKTLDDIDLDKIPEVPLPRVNAEELIGKLGQVSPQVMEAMQHLQSMKQMGIENEQTENLEKQIQENLNTATQQAEEGLHEAEKAFKEGYFMGAHFMKDGLSPHKDPVEDVASRLLKAIAEGEDVSNGDWACIDLSYQNLDGVDLSGTFLEQVNFTGASLKGANLSKAIMARAILEDADLSQANLEEANVGGVHALRTDFTDANLKSAKLSKGDFTDAVFTRSELEDTESLEIIVNGADFTQAIMPSMKFIESEIKGTIFSKADLTATMFYDCAIKNANFSEAIMHSCTWADVRLNNVIFDGTDLTGSCFVATDPEKTVLENVRFAGACLNKCNLQEMRMPDTDLTYTSMENANFTKADLSGADLYGAYARGAQFKKTILTEARMDEINLMEGFLSKAYLIRTSFDHANLYGVDFLRAVIQDTDFINCNMENTLKE